MDRTRVLMIVPEFPPVNTTGNFRMLKFVKYLYEFGIDPIVVTLESHFGARFFHTKIDEALLKEIPPSCKVYRIDVSGKWVSGGSRISNFFRIYFSIKDNLAKTWKKDLLLTVNEIVRSYQPQAIFTSLPPFSSGKLVGKIAKKYQLPLVVDMRDLWANWGVGPKATRIHYLLTLKEERKLFMTASAVVGVTPQVISTFKKHHESVPPQKFHYIPNGFDTPVDNIKPFEFLAKNKVVIGYVGSFYYNPDTRENTFKKWCQRKGHRAFQYAPVKEDWLYRSPYFFLKAISVLFSVKPELRQRIKIEFVGHKPDWLIQMIKSFNLEDVVLLHGFVSYKRSLEIQSTFDLLLATSEKVIGAEHYCLPSKIFDYIGMGKPIVAFVTDGIQKQFLQKSRLGIICPPDDMDTAVQTLAALLTGTTRFDPDKNYLSTFHRKYLAQQLATVIKNVISV